MAVSRNPLYTVPKATTSPVATQSAIFTFSAENWKIGRMFAHFLFRELAEKLGRLRSCHLPCRHSAIGTRYRLSGGRDLIRARIGRGSVLIWERGSGVRIDCLPATQSAIFAFSAENAKIARTVAHFLRPEGTGEAQIRPQQLIYARFSLSRIEAVPFRTNSAARRWLRAAGALN